MLSIFKRVSLFGLLLCAALLAACSLFAPSKPSPTAPAVRPDADMLGAIHAAGDREKSVIDVNPLREPGVGALQDAALRDQASGQYAAAAGKLDQAIRLSPDSPDLLQDRAEVAILMKDYATAEKLARQSWSIGPKLGPLCARNWQTVVEMRLQAGDAGGAASARQSLQTCHKAAIPRY
jgi:tetratricopeptide (TPR) repeat protein